MVTDVARAERDQAEKEAEIAAYSRMEAQIKVTEGLLIHVQAIGGVSDDPQIQIEASKWELRLQHELDELRRKREVGPE